MKLNTLRPRRLRITPAIRDMIRENEVTVKDLVYPIFVVAGTGVQEEIPSMPGCYHLSVDKALELAREIAELGIPAVEIFGLPEYKDEIGSSAWDMTSPVQRAIRAIKKDLPQLVIVGDVCLCQYTTHGHCGQLCGHYVDNDATLELLCKVAVSQAECGADNRPVGYDGWPYRCYPRRLGWAGLPEYDNHVLRGEICLRFLWSLPRCGQFGATVRQPLPISDGPGQWTGSLEGSSPRYG